jgi:hypothetical protein
MGVSEVRPFFSYSSEEVAEVGFEAIVEHDNERASFAILEAKRRKKAPYVYSKLLEIASESEVNLIPWLETVLGVSREFQSSGAGECSVYLVLLKNKDGDLGVYVGQTGKTPQERFTEHKNGYKSSKHVKSKGICLLELVQEHLVELTREEAEDIEARLADRIKSEGIWTEGGH